MEALSENARGSREVSNGACFILQTRGKEEGTFEIPAEGKAAMIDVTDFIRRKTSTQDKGVAVDILRKRGKEKRDEGRTWGRVRSTN